MTEIDNKNLEIIEGLVEKHFDLDKDSFSLFKERLHSPVIDPVYQEILKGSSDLRVRYRIPEEQYETFDKGWPLFKKFFPDFVRQTNISYSDFRSNRLSFKGKTLKLKKALTDFYLNNTNSSYAFLDGIHINPKDEAHVNYLDNKITEHLNRVGVQKLPSSGLELVLSLNFADWFLAATAEKWKSCINLESDFSGAYWAGLPGLIGDKNRSMLYINDGNRKNYKGIKVESCISRSWTMLDGQGRLNLIRFFPADLLDATTIADATKLPFRYGSDFSSKHPVDVLYFNNRRSCFIYTDNSRFRKTLGAYYIQKADGGRFGYVDKDSGSVVDGVNVFNYKDGLGKLVDKSLSLGDIFTKTCSGCGNYRDEYHEFQGRIFCNDCFQRYILTCDHCGKQVLADANEYKSVGRKKYCLECFNKLFVECNTCGEVHLKAEMYRFIDMDMWYCKKCVAGLEEDYKSCTKCHDSFFEAPENYYNIISDDEILCERCTKIATDRQQYFFAF